MMQSNFPPLLNHLLTGMLILDKNLSILQVNTALEQMLCASQSQILQHNILDILQPKHSETANHHDFNQTLSQQFAHCRQLHQAFIQYNVLIQGIHQPILVDYGVTPVEDGEQFYFVVELWAKDRQSRIEQEQYQHQQHHVTRQLIRSMAHEVKNPLAGILGASQLLQKLLDKSSLNPNPSTDKNLAKIDTYLTIIMDETRRLNHLVNQLLGSPALPHWQSLNIHKPLEHVLTLLDLSPSNIQVVRDYDLSLPDVVADNDQLIQVFLNLLNNAVQALTENNVPNPCITLRTRIDYQQTIGDIRHKSVSKISVIDNGVGIDSELLPTIFYPLVTRRATGTGLGLALVQDIIERHHGLITVQSEKGKTQFDILLPFDLEKK